MKCKGVYSYICQNLDADMRSARCRAIRKHLVTCPDCAAYLDSLKKTIVLYRTEPGTSVPPQVHKRLVRAIDIAMLDFPNNKRRTRHTRREGRVKR